jgi:hypothetical protein
VIVIGRDREPAEHRIAVRGAVNSSILTDAKIHAEVFGNRADLIAFALYFIHSDNFLKRDDIGVDLIQYRRNALGPYAAIETPTLMNVVGCNPKRRHPENDTLFALRVKSL